MAKRRAELGRSRTIKSLSRKQNKRQVSKKILVVCQGGKTEHGYFIALRNDLKRGGISVNVPEDGHGFNAKGLLKHAKSLAKKEARKGDGFDKIFIVFDRDDDQTFAHTIESVATCTPKDVYVACYSIPCFEYWILLHFEESRRPYHFINGSWSSQLCREIRDNHISQYNKSGVLAYNQTKDRIAEAIERSKRCLTDSHRTGESNPSTTVHLIFEYVNE